MYTNYPYIRPILDFTWNRSWWVSPDLKSFDIVPLGQLSVCLFRTKLISLDFLRTLKFCSSFMPDQSGVYGTNLLKTTFLDYIGIGYTLVKGAVSTDF